MRSTRFLAPAVAMVCVLLAAAGARAQTAPVIAAAGDIACDPEGASYNGGDGTGKRCRQKYTSDLLVDQYNSSAGLAAVLAVGDTQYEDGALYKFELSYDPSWGRVKGITYPAVGNHEYRVTGAAGYFDYYNGIEAFGGSAGDRDKGYYSFDVGGWHMITLNSMCDQVGGCQDASVQAQWLEQDLAAEAASADPASCTLAQAHHPFYNSGPSGIYWFMQDFWETLYDAGADIVLGGHAHTYEQFRPQDAYENLDLEYGMRQFIVGTGGKSLGSTHDTLHPNSELRDNSHFGVLKLTLHSNSYDWAFVNDRGRTVYSGTEQCHDAPGSTTPEPPPADDTSPPETTISSGPSGRIKETTATFGFVSSEDPSTFKCRLDGGDWVDCTSPRTYEGLAAGEHTFAVFAIDAAGNADPTPATRTFKVAGAKGNGSGNKGLSPAS